MNTYAVMKFGFKKVDNSGKNAPIPGHRAQTRFVCITQFSISIYIYMLPTLLIVFLYGYSLTDFIHISLWYFFRMTTVQEHNFMKIQKNWMYKHCISWNMEWPMDACQ